MSENTALNEVVRNLFAAQPLGILATQGNGYPYCNIVAFTPSDDLRYPDYRDTARHVKI